MTDLTDELNVDKKEEHGLASYEAVEEDTVQCEGGHSEMLLAGGTVLVTMDIGLSLFCAPCHRTVCRGAGVQLTGGEIR